MSKTIICATLIKGEMRIIKTVFVGNKITDQQVYYQFGKGRI
jgi:hypothetical protein